MGVTGEAIADAQLQSWKDNRKPEEKIFREGLFKRARHPNLFFELVFWFGMSCYAVTTDDMNSFCAFIGPFVLWSAMYFVTIPITTKHMKKSRPNYDEIINETNVFLPFC
jgi:steroid 5-alpha reductase family enzyme